MDKNTDFNNFGGFPPYSPYMSYENIDNPFQDNSIFNPVFQYEQGYMYYRYLTKQLEYKIKCKEYEKLCGNNRQERRVE